MKELQPDILNDYEHLVIRGIDHHGGEEGFPSMEDSNIVRKDLEDFLYEYQRILDSPGSEKAQLTKYGIVAVIPVIILSAFPEQMLPWGKYSFFAGIALGLLLALMLKGLSMLSVNRAIKRLKSDNREMAEYAEKVEKFVREKELR
jgi:hypothetical protein